MTTKAVVVKPQYVQSICSYLHPCDGLTAQPCHWYFGVAAADSIVRQLIIPKRSVFLLRWTLGCEFFGYVDVHRFKKQLNIVDYPSTLSGNAEYEQGMDKLLQLLKEADKFQLDVIDMNLDRNMHYLQTLIIDTSFPRHFPLMHRQFNTGLNRAGINYHDTVTRFMNANRWSGTVQGILAQCSTTIQNVLFLDGNRSYGHICNADAVCSANCKTFPASHLSAYMLRVLRVDKILATKMPTLRTVLLPNLFPYDEMSTNNNNVADPWAALLAMPADERLASVQRLILPSTTICSEATVHEFSHQTLLPELPALAAAHAQLELVGSGCSEFSYDQPHPGLDRESFGPRVVGLEQWNVMYKEAVASINSPFRHVKQIVRSSMFKNNSNSLVYDYLNAKQQPERQEKLLQIERHLLAERVCMRVWQETNNFTFVVRRFDLRFERRWLTALVRGKKSSSLLRERLEQLFQLIRKNAVILKLHVCQPDICISNDGMSFEMLKNFGKLLPCFDTSNANARARQQQQQITQQNLRLHIDMCGKTSLDAALAAYRQRHEEENEWGAAKEPIAPVNSGVYYLLPPVKITQTVKFDRLDERIMWMPDDDHMQYLEDRISEQFTALLRDAAEAANLRAKNLSEDDDAAVTRDGDYRNIIYRHVEQVEFQPEFLSKTEAATQHNWRVLEQSLMDEATALYGGALPKLKSVKIKGAY